MKTGSKIITIGCILIVAGLPLFLLSGDLLPNIFAILLGILWIITGVFKNKGYYNKNCYMAIFSVIALWGLTLLYIFLFRTNEYLEDMGMFYIFAGLFILLMIMFGRGYIRRLMDVNRRKELDL
ncbi:hypothetical protein [Methanobacterium sp.]|uniref:hypothetical protein n=1 Tax=Methanobacterium sp. TaxID=2164 RepID=UPI003157F879